MVRGVVKWFNFEKGFGFIEITSGKEAGSDIFVHASDIEGNPLRDDDQVEKCNRLRRAMLVPGGSCNCHDDFHKSWSGGAALFSVPGPDGDD